MSADRLPAAAAAKLQRLVMTASDTRALMTASLDAAGKAENKLAAARDAHACIPTSEAQRVIDAQRAVDVAEAELHGLRQLTAQRRTAHDEAAQLVTHINQWLRRLPPDLKLVERTVPLIADSELDHAVELLRQDISAVEGDIAMLKSASLSKADLHARAKEYVAQLAERGAPRIRCVGDRLDIDFRDPQAFAVSVNDTVRLLAWFNSTLLLSKLDTEIDKQVRPGKLDATERNKQAVKLARELLDLERSEEALIELAESRGQFIPRRTTADVRAILCIAAVVPAFAVKQEDKHEKVESHQQAKAG